MPQDREACIKKDVLLVDWESVVHASFVEKVDDLNDVLGSRSEHYGGGCSGTARGMAEKRSVNEASSIEIAKGLFQLVMVSRHEDRETRNGTYKNWRSVADQVCCRLIIAKSKTEMVRQLLMPLIKFVRQRMQLLQRDSIRCSRRIQVFKCLGKDSRHAEQSKST